MSPLKICIPIFLVCILLAGTAGCLSYSFGEVNYESGSLNVSMNNEGSAGESAVQVTIFSLKDFRQTEINKLVQPVTLKEGENEFSIPVDLEPGSYKLYLYLIIDGERKNCEIRDIEV